jgi:nucleotide-binding universal stress UspA family protein
VRLLLGSQAHEVVTRASIPVLIVKALKDAAGDAVASPRDGAIYSSITIATDGSPTAEKAVDQGLALAQQVGATVTFVVASGVVSGLGLEGLPPIGIWSTQADIAKATASTAEAILRRCAETADARGVGHNEVHVHNKVASDAILATAAEAGSDLIVMSTQSRSGVERLILGRQTQDVLSRATVPVLVVR